MLYRVTIVPSGPAELDPQSIITEFTECTRVNVDFCDISSIRFVQFWIGGLVSEDFIRKIELHWQCNVFVIPQNVIDACANPNVSKVAVFDLDSTLIQMEVIDTLAAWKPEIGDQVARITEDSMAGRIDFQESLKRRVSLLKGIPIEEAWKKIKETVEFTPGAVEVFQNFFNEQNGWTTAVLSGGFLPIAQWVKERLKLSEAHANMLQVDSDGLLTGQLQPGHAILDSKAKESHLIRLVGQVNSAVSVAVGDGANDLLMLKAATLGIAFNAKPIVQERASYRLNHKNIFMLYHILKD